MHLADRLHELFDDDRYAKPGALAARRGASSTMRIRPEQAGQLALRTIA